MPLGDRKKRLARLLGKRRLGIVLSAHTGDDGATIFQQACKLGLEGIVSKRLSAPYRSGPSRDWLKIKNPDSPAIGPSREGQPETRAVPCAPARGKPSEDLATSWKSWQGGRDRPGGKELRAQYSGRRSAHGKQSRRRRLSLCVQYY
jgi:ATP dependent DNA ligase domain